MAPMLQIDISQVIGQLLLMAIGGLGIVVWWAVRRTQVRLDTLEKCTVKKQEMKDMEAGLKQHHSDTVERAEIAHSETRQRIASIEKKIDQVYLLLIRQYHHRPIQDDEGG